MSTKKSKNNDTIPSLFKNIVLRSNSRKNSKNKNPDYISIHSLTPKFVNIYSKYIKTKKKSIYPNISTVLSKFRSDKLNKLNDQEAMGEEVGKEIKKYKEINNLLKLKGVAFDREKYLNNLMKQYKDKVKENKENLLDKFQQYDSLIKTSSKKSKIINQKAKFAISPYKMFKKSRNVYTDKIQNTYNNKTEVHLNKSKIFKLIDLNKKEDSKSKEKKGIRMKESMEQCHQKINSFCDSIEIDAIKAKFKGRKRIDKFNTTWNKYKLLQEYKHPEIRYYTKNNFI
jgi:hypothetical protein